MREICTAGSDRGARHKPPMAARPQASTDQVDPLICTQCGDRMVPVAAILKSESIVRVLTHLGLPADFPKLALARSPPDIRAEESQVDPNEPLSAEIDWIPPDDLPASSQSCDA